MTSVERGGLLALLLLLEHKRLISQLHAIVEEARQDPPVIAAISGMTAMGKSTLLHDFERQASAAGITVLSARCAPAEQNHPYSALGQLFAATGLPCPVLEPQPSATLPTPDELLEAGQRTLHAVTELAAQGTVVISVDDIQRADAASLHCLQYMAHRPATAPVAFVFTWDLPYDRETQPVLESLMYHPALRRIQLEPLSGWDIVQMIEEQPGVQATDVLADAYHSLTGGNPLLVDALLNDGDGSGIRRAILDCLRRAGGMALRVARSIAVLGEPVEVHMLSRLNGTSPAMTRQVLRKLTDIGVLDGLRFRHSAAGPVILGDLSQQEEMELRYRAAHLLHQEGQPSTVIAQRLLTAGPLCQDWVLPVLRDAAERALADNQVSLSLRYLQLLSECCLDEGQRHAIAARMAEGEWLRKPPASPPHLLSLKDPILTGEVDSGSALSTAELMLSNLQFDEALEIIRHLGKQVREEHPQRAIESLSAGLIVSSTYPGLGSRLPRPAAAVSRSSHLPRLAAHPPMLRAHHALWEVLTRQADKHTIAQAEQVLQDGGFSHSSCRVIGPAILSLVYADLLEPAAAWCDRFLNGPTSHDVPAWRGLIGGISALVSFREGHLDVAVKEAETALGHTEGPEWNESSGLALATLAEAHTAIGSHDIAAELFARPVSPALLETRAGLHYLHARGRHHLATGHAQAALVDFEACGERMLRWQIDNPALAPWRAGAAEAWLSLGERRRAAGLVETRAPDTGLDLIRARGINLRCQAALRRVQERPSILEQALQALQQSGDRYHTAQVLADLSETYQSLGDKAKARTAARRARRIAESCHADKLCRTLVSANLPPSKHSEEYSLAADGNKFAKLSDSERRVAILAAQGYTNREISDRLHVTVSTVEQHLTRVYRKMHIKNREELPTEFRIDASQIS
ncbi:AAA family ATPase [Streptomyces echinatus]|uniref:helix-turn-helix transcriptional regulator n=1 Tax=Streptomyces echinatus TaxID=67293 RepID=UPI0037929EAE